MSARTRVVVVTWNGRHLLGECLDSLAQQRDASFETVVVDNASTDGTAAWLAERFPDVRVISSDSNRGFAGGVDLGMADFTGEHVVLLNNDATFDDDAIRRLIDHADAPENARVGAFTAKVLLADGGERQLVNSTGNIVFAKGAGTDRDWLSEDGQESRDPEVFGFCGAAVLLRMSALRDVGGFDASLFLYYEDTDLSWRLRAHDWDVHYVGDVVARHRHAASSDDTSALFRYYNTRNALIVFTRHAPWGVVAKVLGRQLVALAVASVRTHWPDTILSARGRAVRDHLRRLPRTLRERRRLWTGTRGGQRLRVARRFLL